VLPDNFIDQPCVNFIANRAKFSFLNMECSGLIKPILLKPNSCFLFCSVVVQDKSAKQISKKVVRGISAKQQRLYWRKMLLKILRLSTVTAFIF